MSNPDAGLSKRSLPLSVDRHFESNYVVMSGRRVKDTADEYLLRYRCIVVVFNAHEVKVDC